MTGILFSLKRVKRPEGSLREPAKYIISSQPASNSDLIKACPSVRCYRHSPVRTKPLTSTLDFKIGSSCVHAGAAIGEKTRSILTATKTEKSCAFHVYPLKIKITNHAYLIFFV